MHETGEGHGLNLKQETRAIDFKIKQEAQHKKYKWPNKGKTKPVGGKNQCGGLGRLELAGVEWGMDPHLFKSQLD